MKNKGIQLEKDMISHINGKYFKELNNNIQSFISFLYKDELNKGKIFVANKFYNNYKPDIVIEHNGIKKYISVKSGKSCSVHQEHIYSFINFLQGLNCPDVLIRNLKLFHFNDGTENGSGGVRKNAMDFQETKYEDIKAINSFFNNKEVIGKIVDRVLFSGEYYGIPKVNYIYYGNLEKGYWANSDDIKEHLQTCHTFSSSIHTSKLYYQSLHRNLKFEIEHEYRRYYVQFKWYSIEEDLLKIIKSKKV